MLISLSSLATTHKFQKNICFKRRAVSPININTKECKGGRHLWNWSIDGRNPNLRHFKFIVIGKSTEKIDQLDPIIKLSNLTIVIISSIICRPLSIVQYRPESHFYVLAHAQKEAVLVIAFVKGNSLLAGGWMVEKTGIRNEVAILDSRGWVWAGLKVQTQPRESKMATSLRIPVFSTIQPPAIRL